MYGVINDAVRQLVIDKFGKAAWEGICNAAGVEESFQLHDYYEDADTVKLVQAAAAALGVEGSAVLELFGEYFAGYLKQRGHDELLGLLGGTIVDFLPVMILQSRTFLD